MSLTSYRAAPPRVNVVGGLVCLVCLIVKVFWLGLIGRPGGDLLSRALRHSTIGAGGFHGRVRDGIGCRAPAITTRSSKQASDLCYRMLCFVSAVPPALAGLVTGMPLRERIKPIERLVPVSFTCCHASTPGLSTWWSSTALRETWFRGELPA